MIMPLAIKEMSIYCLELLSVTDGHSWWKMRTMDGTEGWAVDMLGWYTWSK